MDYYNYYNQQQDGFHTQHEYYSPQVQYRKRVKPRKERSQDYISSSHYYDSYQDPSYITSEYPESHDQYYVPSQRKQKSKYPDDQSRRSMYEDHDETYSNPSDDTGERSLTYAEDEEDEADVKTQMNTIKNSEPIVIEDPVDPTEEEAVVVGPTPTSVKEETKKKPKWFKQIKLVLVKKVKGLKKRNKPSATTPLIQMITATDNEVLGDVLNAQQQKEILTQLSTCASPMSCNNMSPEKTMITNLPRIWVFRLLSAEQDKDIAWIGFDYENQMKIENHVKELQNNIPEDGRLAIYDSHIRFGKMPVIVTPNETKGFYFSDESQTELITLEVTFIENNHQKMDLLAFNIKDAFNAEEFQTALSWLPDQEHSLVTRFKFERDQHLALASLLLRRHYFSERLQVPWSALEFDKLPLGKPILKNQDIEYNTSHEGNWVIFGATKQKGIQIGVDAVVIDCPKSMSIDDFIQSFHPQLTEHEMQLIKNAENHDMQLRTFFELWACKESYIKAIGVGLSLKLNKLDFRNENNQIKLKLDGQDLTSWRFHLSSLDDNTLTVVCYGHQSDQKLDTNIIDFPFNTKLLGNKPLHGNAIFGQLKYQDLKNNKWIESRK